MTQPFIEQSHDDYPSPAMHNFLLITFAALILVASVAYKAGHWPSEADLEVLGPPSIMRTNGTIQASFSVSQPLTPEQELKWKKTIDAWEAEHPGRLVCREKVQREGVRYTLVTIVPE